MKSKKAKLIKPAEDPRNPAPEPATSTPPAQSKAPEDPTFHAQLDPPEPSADETIVDPSTVRPSSSANPPASSDHDVLITGSRFVEPGTPTVLDWHTAKQEALEKQKVCFDISHYTHLSDILFGYLSHVHSSRESEIEMVKQLQLKYEVCCPVYLYSASPQVFR